MNILLAHNLYKQAGGEDVVFAEESRLLKSKGHLVQEILRTNADIESFSRKVKTALGTPYSCSEKHRMKAAILKGGVEIMHVHNFFPQFSPSIFYACAQTPARSVLTLHNYRTICPTALLMHRGEINETSIQSGPFWAVPERAYQGSVSGTAILALMIQLHRSMGTWLRKVDRFIALTEFARSKFVQAGFPAEKIAVKPNFVFDPLDGAEEVISSGKYALYVGRLTPGKGIEILLQAWRNVDFPLRVVGDGPLAEVVACDTNPNVEYLGNRSRQEVQQMMRSAKFLVAPSTWYEGMPMVVIEAYSNGLPVVASAIGGLGEIVSNGITGLHVVPGNGDDLAKTCQTLVDSPGDLQQMRRNVRREYLSKYTPEENYRQLMQVYEDARR